MKCKLEKLEIPKEQPFKNCKLNREKYAEILKTIITTYEKGFVLAINGRWGTGKTTFVEMWKAYLELDGFHTLYFNAWENDFISDPLVGLLGELKKISSQKKAEDTLSSIISSAGKIVLKTAPSIFKGVVKKHVGEEVIEILCDGIEEGTSMLRKEIENYEKQKYSLKEFREELEKYIDEVCNKEPLIFIIDELDRCNPHYAVKILERIKHLFNIPNIVFVLSIDKEQLSNSIRGYYGSDLINANEYLKRFIDIEYTLPDPDVESFCRYLFDYYDFDTAFYYTQNQTLYHGASDIDDFLVTAASIFRYKKLTLRQVEKVFTNIRLSLNMFSNKDNMHTDLLYLLTYLRICESDCYEKIVRKEYTVQELIYQIEKIFPKQIFEINTNNIDTPNLRFYFTTALLLNTYWRNQFGTNDNKQLLTSLEEDAKISFNVNIINEVHLTSALKFTNSNTTIKPLEYITTKINLLENLQT
jgi:hypothetical protein